VAFADKVDDDRVTVILSHGDRFFTVYGNLVRTDVKAGDTLTPNTALGPVASRGNDGPTLHFELRKNGQSVDPGPWLGL
jgi:murein DD-endopeptidase MepM/ murein hydrolase activator NlpD